ncbi:hypothetical protein [Archaeoglobus fulgidus]|jgi:hypothetical protein|uniref:Uncharacterized protein AF_2020 n=4 Tax=Archaeoglobus TaxID=2233 RepID=Y2020_ARCFU|nr:hypothetical protein [Archaeoglobus fulgidus]O28259.1 RecName: Full=Uncharacterized protein AF_2020 [Archaeoglobus fulgidus DSM 4304]AAB89241.1 predicted coding region AF_2020 [Archaeoglobus fulgidus DSM 4304]AIG99010.1 hypothetical protein AFULGI_00022850 [Archaeoglobus fulgidus DSM 8774]KUJ92620.1 MAG: hypothetical protein XD40_2183 [Archaeoglobus fulgidus]KUK05939.1 MAG: Uncharacterized protein XD48_1827 [Archaeoglobus fulgidus]
MVKIRLHTTVSSETARKIEDLKKKHRTTSSVVEKAVDLLYTSENFSRLGDEDLLILAFIRELNFMLCAKDHYTALVEGDAERAVRESMIEMAVKYLSKKPISDLDFEELLSVVARLWNLLNRAEHAEVQKDGEKLNFVFYHDMRSKAVSELHLNLLKYLYEKYYSKKYEMQVDTITVNGFSVLFFPKDSVD